MLGGIVFVVIHADDDGYVVALGRCGNNDLLGAGVEMPLRLGCLREKPGRFDHNVDSKIFPRHGRRPLPDCKALDLVAVDDQHVIFLGLGG